jgi:hypothetical protein
MKEGIIGKLPWEQTRIELGLGVGEGENNLEGEKTRDDFPPADAAGWCQIDSHLFLVSHI